MNGQQMLTLLGSILNGEDIDPVYGLQLINNERVIAEAMRPWMVLKTLDQSQTVTGANTFTNPFNLPTSPQFRRFLGEGSIQLWDGNDNIQKLTEVPFEEYLYYKDIFGRFCVDFANGVFYILGVVPGNFMIRQYYIKDPGDITLTTTWNNGRFQNYDAMLVYNAAARWRLGTDYDDVNARNADDNGRMGLRIFEAASAWDNELVLGSVTNLDYANDRFPGVMGGRGVDDSAYPYWR